MKIVWSPLAGERLDKVYEFIAQDNTSAAQKMVNRIIKKVDTLSRIQKGEEKYQKPIEKKFVKYLKGNIE